MSKGSKSPKLNRQVSNVDKIWSVFGPEDLRRICQMDERDFAAAYDMKTIKVDQPDPSNFYNFRDNGSDILAVAHLDTVSKPGARGCNFLNTSGGTVVYSRALDDRLGAYTILDVLPRLGLEFDVLLTVGEETGQSTAQFFDAPKQYNWVIEFDRGGTDVVMYQYEDFEVREMVKDSGAKVGEGIFSDICYLDHLGVKAFNWGIGYQDYHSARSHAYLDDTFGMIAKFMEFHDAQADTYMPHYDDGDYYYGRTSSSIYSQYDNDKELQAWLQDHA